MIGRTIGGYRILKKLGEGGMGVVWKAEDVLLRMPVALKFLPVDVARDREHRARFLRGAQAAARLDHHGIARVLRADEEDGDVFIAIQFVDGETVRQRLERGEMPIEEAVRIAREAAEALAHAHEVGILHRDISANNIMLTREGQVRVVDFGLALAEDGTAVTRRSQVVGTPGYMAPERMFGSDATRAGDLFGLGVVLYQMLTGRLPYEGYGVAAEPAPPATLRPGVPLALERVVLRAVQQLPAKRHADLRTFAGELKQVADSGALSAKRPAPQRMVEAIERRFQALLRAPGRIPAALGGAAALVGILGLVFALVPSLRERVFPSRVIPGSFRSVAVLPFENLSADQEVTAPFLEGLGEDVARRLALLPNQRVVPWTTSRRFQPGSRPAREIASELQVDALIMGTYLEQGDQVKVTVELVDREGGQRGSRSFDGPGDDLLQVHRNLALATAAWLTGALNKDVVEVVAAPPTHSAEAWDFYVQGTHALGRDTEDSFSTAQGYFERALAFDGDFADAYVGLGAVHNARFFYGLPGGYTGLQEAEASFDQALRLRPGLRSAERGLISVYWERGESQRCLDLAQSLTRQGFSDVEGLVVAATGWLFGGLPARAVEPLLEAIRQDPANEGAHFLLVVARAWSGQPREAIADGRIFFRRFGHSPEIHTWVAVAYHELGDPLRPYAPEAYPAEYDSARSHYRIALQSFGDNTNFYSMLYAASLDRAMGWPDSARALIERARALAERRVERAPDNLRVRGWLAVIYERLGMKRQFLEIVDNYFLGQTAIKLPTNSHVYLMLAFANLGDPAGVRRMFALMRPDDHEEWIIHAPVFLASLGGEALVSDPEYADIVEALDARYQELEVKYR